MTHVQLNHLLYTHTVAIYSIPTRCNHLLCTQHTVHMCHLLYTLYRSNTCGHLLYTDHAHMAIYSILTIHMWPSTLSHAADPFHLHKHKRLKLANYMVVHCMYARVSSRGGQGGAFAPPCHYIAPLGIYGVIFNKCIITT